MGRPARLVNAALTSRVARRSSPRVISWCHREVARVISTTEVVIKSVSWRVAGNRKRACQFDQDDLEPCPLHDVEPVTRRRQGLNPAGFEVSEIDGVVDVLVGIEFVEPGSHLVAMDHPASIFDGASTDTRRSRPRLSLTQSSWTAIQNSLPSGSAITRHEKPGIT